MSITLKEYKKQDARSYMQRSMQVNAFTDYIEVEIPESDTTVGIFDIERDDILEILTDEILKRLESNKLFKVIVDDINFFGLIRSSVIDVVTRENLCPDGDNTGLAEFIINRYVEYHAPSPEPTRIVDERFYDN